MAWGSGTRMRRQSPLLVLCSSLGELQPGGLPHLARPTVRRSEAFLWIDEMTRRNLEPVEPLRSGVRGSTLLETVDATRTPMGARLLRQWLLSPLRHPDAINQRLDAVEVMVGDGRGRARLQEALDGVRDIERLGGRAAAGRATPREAGCASGFISTAAGCRGGANRPWRDVAPERGQSTALVAAGEESSICWATWPVSLRPHWPSDCR